MSLMVAVAPVQIPPSADERLIMHGIAWEQYEQMLAVRGEAAVPRITYLRGELELMSPSRDHERLKSLIRRLVEAYADARGFDLNAYGSWTLRRAPRERGIEPDECYILGPAEENKEVPDLAIEVIWTSGGLDKLEVYLGLGVREVWIWSGTIVVHILRAGRYEPVRRSELFPELDLDLLQSFLDQTNQSEAVRAFRKALAG